MAAATLLVLVEALESVTSSASRSAVCAPIAAKRHGRGWRRLVAQLTSKMYWPKPPAHGKYWDITTRFVVGFGLTGGAIWKFWSLTGGDHHDHEALQRTENAKELER